MEATLLYFLIGGVVLAILGFALTTYFPHKRLDKWEQGYNSAKTSIAQGEDPEELRWEGPEDQWDRGWNHACDEEIIKNLKKSKV